MRNVAKKSRRKSNVAQGNLTVQDSFFKGLKQKCLSSFLRRTIFLDCRGKREVRVRIEKRNDFFAVK